MPKWTEGQSVVAKWLGTWAPGTIAEVCGSGCMVSFGAMFPRCWVANDEIKAP